MAAPTYSQQFSVGLLGTVSNVLAQPMTFWRCTVCGSVVAEGQTGTVGRDLHTSWHASLDTAAANASSALTAANAATSTANSAKTTADAASKTAATAASEASTAKTTAGAAQTAAGNASSAAGQAMTMAQQATITADTANATAQLAVPGADVTLCPLCRATVKTTDLRTHLTYHYRRAHGDPVEFPTDFNPTTQDMAKVDPPQSAKMV